MKQLLTIASAALVVLVATVALFAHQETHKGTVIALEKAGVRVSVVNPKTKETSPMLFEVDKDTKVLRDDKPVTFESAKIQKNETIAVTVDHDIDEHLALVIRVGTTKQVQ
jgi:hypothetical protein